MQRGTPEPKPQPQPRRAGAPHKPGLRRLIEGKRKWHWPERTLPLPPEGGVPNASGTPDPKPEPPPRRADAPHKPGLRRLIEGKRKWHRPERTLPLPPEGSVPNASGTPDPKPEPPPRRAGAPHKPGLRRLIEGKRKWHRPERTLPLPPEGGVPNASGTPPSGGSASPFLGWHERGYLPHFDAPYVTQFVTFMLHDAFPVTRRKEWEGILNEPEYSERRRKLEAWLDR